MKEYIDIGVDGMITDDINSLSKIVKESAVIRLANRDDNPLQPMNYAYGLQIYTGNIIHPAIILV